MVFRTFFVLLIVLFRANSDAQNYPDGAIDRLGIGGYRGVSYSPEGSLLALSGGRGLYILEASSGREVAFLEDSKGRVLRSAVFSPDRSIMACVGGGDISRGNSILIWDTSTWDLISTLDGHEWPVDLLAFLPDGKSSFSDGNMIISQSHEAIRGRDVETGWSLYLEELTGDDTGQWMLSPNLDALVRNIDGRIEVRDPSNGGVLRTLGHKGYAAAFSADGSTLAIIRGRKLVTLVDASTWELKADISTRDQKIDGAVLSYDGSVLATRTWIHGDWNLWNASTGALIRTFPESDHLISSLSFSPDGRLVITSDGETTFLWDIQEDSPFSELPGRLRSVSPDGKTFITQEQQPWSRNLFVHLWNTDASLIKSFGYTSGLTSIEFSPDGQILAAVGFGPTVLWDVSTRTPITALDDDGLNHSGSIAMHPEKEIFVTGYRSCTVQDYSGAKIRSLSPGPVPYTFSLKFAPDGSMLAGIGQNPDVYVWDTSDWTSLAILPGRDHDHQPRSMDFSPDGRLLATSRSRDSLVRIWDTSSWTLADSIEHDRSVHTVVFSPDERILATADGRRVYLWNMASGDTLATFPIWIRQRSLEFSPDGKFLFGIGGGIIMWDVYNRIEAARFKGDGGLLRDMAVSPNRKIVATGGSWDDTVSLWNTATGDSIVELRGHSGDVHSVKFSPDGELLASASLDGTIFLWDVPYLIRDHIPTDVQLPLDLPFSTVLMPNYPNPFNPHTEIVYRLATSGLVRLSIYNTLGQAVRTLVHEHHAPGQYQVSWDARNDEGHSVGAGVYVIGMESSEGTLTRRILHLK